MKPITPLYSTRAVTSSEKYWIIKADGKWYMRIWRVSFRIPATLGRWIVLRTTGVEVSP